LSIDKNVNCRNGVNVEIYDWQENRIVGIRKARLTQFFLDYPHSPKVADRLIPRNLPKPTLP
jgi:hypothetical protein